MVTRQLQVKRRTGKVRRSQTMQRSTTVPRNQPLKRRIKDGSEEDASKRVVNVRKRNKTMSTYDSYP